jgi:AcrR family transcriptional regulator/DNA-binding MarR family transcriptional regulator
MQASGQRIPTRRVGSPGPGGGRVSVPEFQRTRLLDATVALVGAEGYRRLTARRVSAWAGVSNKTFYDLFSDREDCFLAAFDRAIDELSASLRPAWEGEKEWSARVRAALGALLDMLDREPALRALVFVEALGAGSRVLERRGEVLQLCACAIDQGREGAKGRELPSLTAEGLVGAVFGVVYARLLERSGESLAGLVNPLMATIVLPYRGHAVAARELGQRGTRTFSSGREDRAGVKSRACLAEGQAAFSPGASLTSVRDAPADFRLTVRTQMVLVAVANRPGGSNREVSDAAGVADQGQISKLLARLEGLGLLRNDGGETQGIPNAWYLTPRGEEIARLTRTRDHRSPEGAQR